MLESFEVENFQCFEKVELKFLKRVNVVTGTNASGKTALLEAIFFGARATPDGVLALNALRGVQMERPVRPPGTPFQIVPSVTPQQFRSYWDHWFRSKPGTSGDAPTMHFRYMDTDRKRYSLDVFVGKETQAIATHVEGTPEAEPIIVRPIMFERKSGGKSTTSNSSLNPQGNIVHIPVRPLGPAVAFFPAALNFADRDNVRWLSQLKEQGGAQEITEIIKSAFPFISGLEVLAPQGISGIYATLTSGDVRRLQLISSGVHKIVSILLACAQTKNGIILIDEIENGIFYEKFGLVWSMLYRFAKQSNSQIFVTSHSAECLRQLLPVLDSHEDDFSLIRTERQNGNGKCVAIHTSGTSMKAAIEMGAEIRGATVGPETDQT